jgi:dipeptidyl aminopeptidase/acylaminoacyl peptidase
MAAACTDRITPPSPEERVAFTVQPGNATAGIVISPAVAVAIEDASGNAVPSATNVVTVGLGANPGSSALAGTVSVAAVNGVATFSSLRIDAEGIGYTLTASVDGLTGATSRPFDVTTAATATPIIAFQSGRGIEEIHVDGSGRVVLIADSAVSEPAWSPDGAMLAFTRRSADYQTCEIHTARADGSSGWRISGPLVSFADGWCVSTPSWSPDGTKIAFAASAGSVPPGGGIYVVNANGSGIRNLLVDSVFGYPGRPTWSPDGTQLAFECWGADITVFVCAMNADGTGVRNLTPAGGCEWAPAWSPDGSEVAFVGSCEDGGPYTSLGPFGIWLKKPDGSIARNLTAGGFGSDEAPAWSPDGTQLVFARGNPADLYIINRDGSGLRQLTATPHISETFPAWRSDNANGSAGRSLSGFITSTPAARSPR